MSFNNFNSFFYKQNIRELKSSNKLIYHFSRQTLNRPRRRHKWDFAYQFILAYISYGLGFHSMLALDIQDEAKGSFFLGKYQTFQIV